MFSYLKFLELCRVATNSDTVVLDLVQQRYSRTDSHFLGSRDFQQLINTCSGKINADPSNKFVYIRDFVNHLKVHKTKPKKLPPCHQDCSSSPDDVPEPKRYKPGIAAGGSDEHSSTPSSQHKSQNVAHSCENSNKSLQSPERLQNVEIVQEALPAEYASKSQLDVDQLSQHCIKEIGDSNQDGPKEKQQEESSVPKEPASSTNATERHIKRLEKLLAVRC